MKLLTKKLKNDLPKLGETEEINNPKALVKIFTPWTSWTWYIIEYDPETENCFGIADGFEKELGYFSLNEIKGVTGPGGLKVERDMYYTPKTINEIMDWEDKKDE